MPHFTLYSRQFCAKNLLAGVFAATLGIGAMAAQADPAAATAAADTSTGEGSLQEIVVTAQKRTEKEVDVPISVAVLSGTQLTQQSITDVLALPQAVPALRITYSGTFVQPTIRGVGSQVALPGLVQNIATYVDGFYVPDPAADDFNLVNIDSVSVLKGPQGTLFGYSATGGAIQIKTLDPEQQMSGFARLGYGRYGTADAAFYGTTGLTDTLAVNIAGDYEYSDGYIKNIFTDNDHAGEYHRWYVRPKVKWTPNDDMSFVFSYAHDVDNNPLTQNVVARNGETIAIAVPGAEIPTNRGTVALNAPTYSFLTSNSYNLTSKFNLGFADLTSYTGYRTDNEDQALDYDASSAALNGSQWRVPDETFQEEVDLSSKSGGRLDWVAGVFYMHYEDKYDYNTNGNAIFTSDNKTDSLAEFADITYQVVDNLFLTAGARYSMDRPHVGFDLIPFGLDESGDAKFHNLSSRGVVRYQLTPDSNVYGSYTQGYKPGGLPASAFSLVPVQPETIDAYEIGYKTAQSIVRANVAGFFYQYKNIQVTSYGAGGQSETVNAADAHIYGVDGDLTVQVTRDLELTLSAGWTHARYINFPNATATTQNLNPASPTYGTISLVPYNASGNPVERTPDFSGTIGGNYGFDVAGGRLVVNSNLFYTSKFYFDVAEQLPQGSYAILNARATWTDPSKRYDFSIYGTNLTSRQYYIASFTDPYASRAVFGDPAMFGGQVTIHF
jgi:iron complex outermembrane receptor protein